MHEGYILVVGYLLAGLAIASYFTSSTFTFGIHNKYTNVQRYMVRWSEPLNLSEEELSKFDGSNNKEPIYIAIDGDVYDVSSNREMYARPNGAYSFFAGRDAARAFVTGCFGNEEQLTHDLRGLGEQELASLQRWKDFYDNHYSYYKIGTVWHKPLSSEPPPYCRGPQL